MYSSRRKSTTVGLIGTTYGCLTILGIVASIMTLPPGGSHINPEIQKHTSLEIENDYDPDRDLEKLLDYKGL